MKTRSFAQPYSEDDATAKGQCSETRGQHDEGEEELGDVCLKFFVKDELRTGAGERR